MKGKSSARIDLSELEMLFKQHYQSLCSAAYYVTGSEDAARDIVQDFFFICWNKRSDLVITDNFRNYALRSVKNASLNYIRSYRKIVFTDLTQVIENEQVDQVAALDADIEEEEKNLAIWDAINKLPEKRRLIFLSSNKDDLSYVQIAEKFQISVNTVKTQIRLAYQFLRKECEWMVNVFIVLLLLSGLKK